MELHTAYPKFLLCTVGPKEALCCKALPLKTGVVIIAVLDIIVGILSAVELALTLWNLVQETIHYVLLTSAADVLAISAIPFAAMCLHSLSTETYAQVHIYSVYKHVELFVLSAFTLVYFRITCLEGDLGCDIVSMTLIWLARTLFNLYFTHIVWSADIRLANNETVLVLYGCDVIRLMQEQAITSSPRNGVAIELGKDIPMGRIESP